MLYYIALAAVAGFLLPLQALMNARTSQALGGPLLATLVSFAGGALMIALLLAVLRVPAPSVDQIGKVPLYGWVTGLVGVFFVAQAAFTVDKLGAAAMIAIVIAGQMFGSIAFDHFGILQAPQPVTWQKVAGACLLLGGVWLILRPGQ